MFANILVLFVAVCSVNFTNGGVSNKYPGAIVFPDTYKEELETRYGTGDGVPDECKGQTYCLTKPAHYPVERYNKLFAHMKYVKQPSVVISEIDDRYSDPNEKDGCSSVVTYEPLYQVNVNGKWRKVIQAPGSNYLQQVRMEKCNPKVNRCFGEQPPLPGITTVCRQKNVAWEFLVDDDKGGTERVTAELPICCACMYKTD